MKKIILFLVFNSFLFSYSHITFEEDLKKPFPNIFSFVGKTSFYSYYKYSDFSKKVCSKNFKFDIKNKNIYNDFYEDSLNLYRKCIIDNVNHQQFIQDQIDKKEFNRKINNLITFLFGWIH